MRSRDSAIRVRPQQRHEQSDLREYSAAKLKVPEMRLYRHSNGEHTDEKGERGGRHIRFKQETGCSSVKFIPKAHDVAKHRNRTVAQAIP